MMNATTIIRPYAKAILSLARLDNSYAKWSKILEFLATVVKDNSVTNFLSNLSIPHQEKAQFICDVCGEALNPQAQNLIKILAQNKRLLLLTELYKVYEELRMEAQRQLGLTLTTAQDIDKDLIASLTNSLAKNFNEQVILNYAVDASLIGGGKLNIGDRVINSSIQDRLKTLYSHLIQ